MNQNTINAFFTACSAILASKANTPLEEELQRSVADLMEDATLATLQQDGIDNNLFFMSKDGFMPTKKGYNALFGENTKVVFKKSNLRKMPHQSLLEEFVNTGKELCYRAVEWPNFQKELDNSKVLLELQNTMQCVTDSVNAAITTEV